MAWPLQLTSAYRRADLFHVVRHPTALKNATGFTVFPFSHVWYGYPVFFPIRTKCRLFLKETRKPLLANHVILFPTHLAKMVHRLTRGDIWLFIVTFNLVAILNEDIQEFICIAKFQNQIYAGNFVAEELSSSVLDDISTMPCVSKEVLYLIDIFSFFVLPFLNEDCKAITLVDVQRELLIVLNDGHLSHLILPIPD